MPVGTRRSRHTEPKWKWNASRNLDQSGSYPHTHTHTHLHNNNKWRKQIWGDFLFFSCCLDTICDMWTIRIIQKSNVDVLMCFFSSFCSIRLAFNFARSIFYLVANYAVCPNIFRGTNKHMHCKGKWHWTTHPGHIRTDRLNKICSFHVSFVWFFSFDIRFSSFPFLFFLVK